MRRKNRRSWLILFGIAYIILSVYLQLLPNHFWRGVRRRGSKISTAVTATKCRWRSYAFEHSRIPPKASPIENCPRFFNWMQKDLAPWLNSGINERDLEEARQKATFRVVVKDGRLYYKKYYNCFQSRGVLTLWGLLMLLERFPGQVPDVDLMFNCADIPEIPKSLHHSPVPLFGYSTNNGSYDIPFPDWSFWGWPEINIDVWDQEGAAIFANKKPWSQRKTFAHWKGNPEVAKIRKHLLGCNETGVAEIYSQDWIAEISNNFLSSKLSEQCDHRYKIYAEGNSWSVSFKYIMACGSTVLDIHHRYHDFFTRSLVPWLHFIPVKQETDQLCKSIKKAVLWGNEHPEEAEHIGRHGQEFLKNELTIDRVYDYMFHLLKRYSYLLNFQPEIPPGATLLSPSYLACTAKDEHREYLKGLKIPEPATPCTMAERL